MTWHAWLIFAVTELLLCISPGPAVLFVISHGLLRGGAASLWANAGILAGNTFYFLVSACGLGAVLLASRYLFVLTKIAGAAYLVVLGVQTIRGAGLSLESRDPDTARMAGLTTFGRAFALQLSNPKAIVFFIALLPQFLDPTRPIALQIAILAATSVSIEFLVLATYGYLAGRASGLARRPAFVRKSNLASGVMLIVAGASIAFSDVWSGRR
jgi:homoserine/homoserine lactone efflux protein